MKKRIEITAYPIAVMFFLVFLFLIAVNKTAAQDSAYTAPEFPIGAFLSGFPDPVVFNSLDSSGLNTLVWRAREDTKPYLVNYNVIASNGEGPAAGDWIQHYATGYYSRWDAEQNQTDPNRVGVKHKYGQEYLWHDTLSWSTIGLSSPVDSLVYGPHYRQEKRYKRWLYGNRFDVRYTARFRMALDYNPQLVDPSEQVCVIKVVYRYGEVYNTPPPPYDSVNVYDTVFKKDTLTAADFRQDGYFKYFYFEGPNNWYKYPSKFIPGQLEGKLELPADVDTTYTDSNGNNGIQFWVEWLGVGTLYIDYIEVYDNFGWNDFMGDSLITAQAIQNIKDNAQSYLGGDWPNIKYWYGQDEPYTIDAYTPMHIVDSLLKDVVAPRLITEFYPDWRVLVNGDSMLAMFNKMAKPEKLMIDYYPFSKLYDPIRPGDLEAIRKQFQIAHSLQPGFWYVGQGFGRKKPDGSWLDWRLPDSTELKASVMLALAHGLKGLMFWNYDSYQSSDTIFVQGIVNEDFSRTELWYVIKDNFAPRLKGKLGKTLLTLKYSGDYIDMLRNPGDSPLPDQIWRYFTLFNYGSDYYWHAGFLNDNTNQENEFVMLVNLRTEVSRTAKFRVENTTNYENLSARNIEGGAGELDTTIAINSSITVQDEFPPGEGKLYQFSPVVKYGGRLIYDDGVNNETLYDDMIIENGATLGIYGDYYVDADIIVKDGGRIVNTGNGKITFYNDHKLILQGNSTLSGLSQDKLVLDFVSPAENNGIIADSGLVIHISNCEIKNAGTGITVSSFSSTAPESEDFHFRVDSVDFNSCEDFGINITGQYVNKAKIEHSSFTGSVYGVSAVNLNEVVIFNNYFTNTEMGIRLINITKADVIGNIITSN